ncbi:4-(cytidine 5'-diphospho)-2-C-methyl-D-erythritol kinase [Echinicola jeungdonensis]|uniref:4-diphosphocytidyl-2-C-methyl-D-erythritol kinase n=1 Tax=Echinicola jeungdonensis TaxID=709343 RepID=A0ABV5J834_9BACT|nr:4-(cytidine 5'-diphospho)-2-C-methyl-D-erythritol kinase [Echinicola jeungdonensis]MDN3669707.1 4-(cytidine 5'-diphospho)-2-C-methyl-D-erythritol kinase [Echinicola jeungdonensis]
MIQFPNAKINLGLHITEKRKDGFHEIETCLFPIPLCDALEMIPAPKTTFKNTGLQVPGNEKQNLIFKALKLLRKDFNDLPHVSMHLHKAIPMGAGLGGGSSDAAFALKIMNMLFNLHLEDWFLEDYAAELGSDCPFFIQNKPQLAKGRGEILEEVEVNLKGRWLVLVQPKIHISTQEAYAGIIPKSPAHPLKEILMDPKSWKEKLVNNFEESIFKKHPQIGAIKENLYQQGAFYAAMSGSGSTVFGLFDQEPSISNWPEDYFTYKNQL